MGQGRRSRSWDGEHGWLSECCYGNGRFDRAPPNSQFPGRQRSGTSPGPSPSRTLSGSALGPAPRPALSRSDLAWHRAGADGSGGRAEEGRHGGGGGGFPSPGGAGTAGRRAPGSACPGAAGRRAARAAAAEDASGERWPGPRPSGAPQPVKVTAGRLRARAGGGGGGHPRGTSARAWSPLPARRSPGAGPGAHTSGRLDPSAGTTGQACAVGAEASARRALPGWFLPLAVQPGPAF